MTVLCDGLCKPTNPGGLGCWGFAILSDEGQEIAHGSGCIGRGEGMTNQVAEYHAVIEGLKWVVENASDVDIVIKTDSQLVVSQVNGTMNCHSQPLCDLRDKVLALLRQTKARLEWIPRTENNHADAHAQLAYQRRQSMTDAQNPGGILID
jgi:ribonuclease HI